MHAKRMSNEELLAALTAALREEGTVIARVVVMLMDVEARRLYLDAACPSLYDFCKRKLGMSEGEAYRRSHAVQLARRFPAVLEALRSQRIHLSNLVLLKEFLEPSNVDRVLSAVEGKTKREVKELLACWSPKPDAPSRIRKLPDLKPAPSANVAPSSTFAVRAPQVVPLSEARHKVQFTASTALRKKLEFAQSLMRHRNIDGDLAVVVERAVDLLIVKLGKQKYGVTLDANADLVPSDTSPEVNVALDSAALDMDAATPHTPDPIAGAMSGPAVAATKPRKTAIPAAVKREVVQRDQGQCSFVSAGGERCPARELLEIDHRHPRALGGSDDVENLRLLCRAHNQHEAERAFGRKAIARAIHVRRRKRAA